LSHHRAQLTISLACAAAFGLAGCTNSVRIFEDQNDGGWFSRPAFTKPDWAKPSAGKINLSLMGPVNAEDLVSTEGQCAAPAAAAVQTAEASPATTEPAQPADRAVGSVAGDLAGAPMPTATPASAPSGPGLQRLEPAPAPLASGGIALGMTECQTVQRAGTPSNVAISTGEKGERKVVLTYLSGPWPGIYTFAGGRLNVVERAPEQPKPEKTKKTPKKKSPANTAQSGRNYVQ
jgi:hypothetical protein